MDFMGRLFGAGGDLSTMRWVFVWTWGFSIVVPLLAWVYAYCIKTAGTADLPANVTMLVMTIVAVVTTGKVAQYFKEKPDANGTSKS